MGSGLETSREQHRDDAAGSSIPWLVNFASRIKNASASAIKNNPAKLLEENASHRAQESCIPADHTGAMTPDGELGVQTQDANNKEHKERSGSTMRQELLPSGQLERNRAGASSFSLTLVRQIA